MTKLILPLLKTTYYRVIGEIIQYEGIAPFFVFFFLLGVTSVKSKHPFPQVKAKLRITNNVRQPLFVKLNDTKGRRLNRVFIMEVSIIVLIV